jgi:N-terminal domain of cytochrome oxidase-cbb3, FixP
MAEEFDNLEDFESKETARNIPIGWLILFIGLILFGIYYVAAYTPEISGWSQAKEYEESVKK